LNHFTNLILALFITLFSIGNLSAQNNTDEKLANQYFNNKEYDKAVIYYEKLYNKTKKVNLYSKLLTCFIELSESKNAEKLIKRRIKRAPYQLSLKVDLGHLYALFDQESKAKQTYQKAIKEISLDNNQVMDLAANFIRYKEYDYAVQTYHKGRKVLKNGYPFNFELANIYNQKGDVEAMLQEYLAVLAYQESYIQSVQNALQTSLDPDVNGEKKTLLKSLLIKNIQRHPDKKVYSEMLIWTYIQEKNFNGAFIQTKALDKRMKEKGGRLISLAKLALANKDYDAAVKCYKYVIEKGKDNYYYTSSKVELVNVYNQKIINTKNFTQQDLLELEQHYKTTIEELGETAKTIKLIRGLAHLQAFYLHNTSTVIDRLINTFSIPNIKRHDIAEIKIEMADIYLLIGEIWEASLLYSQVEKEYKYDRLGERAKFNNAKISFYTGDFKWARAQLDVLKASTSKLISNDAMELSILITDNIGIDTTEAPLLMFAKADLLAYQNKNKEALQMLDSLKVEYLLHPISDDILYKKYQIHYSQKEYKLAAENLEDIVMDYNQDLLGDDALFNLAQLYDNELNNKEKATELYRQLMFNFQGSIYVVAARKRYRELEKGIKIIKIENDILEFEAN